MSEISKICGIAVAQISKISLVLKGVIDSIYGIDFPAESIGWGLQTPDGADLATPEGDLITIPGVFVTVANTSHAMTSGNTEIFGVSTILQTPIEEDVKTPEEDYVAVVE
jgi:hypothetical protein